jgi:hypothetical protein
MAADVDVESLERTEAAAMLDGDVERLEQIWHTAISMGQEVLEPASGTTGAGQTVTTRYTHVWIRTGDRWQLAARHAPAMVETAT